MNEHTKRRFDMLKEKIGFNAAIASVDRSRSVVYHDFNLRKWNFLREFKSNIPLKEEMHVYENGILKEFSFDTEDNTLDVNLYISSSSHEIAMNKLLNEAFSTTLMVNPYEKCPYDLGDISCSVIGNDNYHIMWTYYNVFFSVEYSGKKVNVEQFCRDLQKYTETFVVNDIERYRPQFDEVVVSSSSIKKGEDVTIYIVPAYGKAFTNEKKQPFNLHLEKNWSGSILSLEKESRFFFRFKGIAEGTETITFILADLDALTVAKKEISITVTK